MSSWRKYEVVKGGKMSLLFVNHFQTISGQFWWAAHGTRFQTHSGLYDSEDSTLEALCEFLDETRGA